MANEPKPHIEERLTKVLIDALLAADDVAALNALRAAQRIIEGQGADAHRLIVSLRGDSPPASDPFAEVNWRATVQKKWDRARTYARNSPNVPLGKKAKELLSRQLSATLTGGKARLPAIDAELEALLAELDDLAQSPPVT